jgi:predicted DNA-binding transcriptional regulator AlpA
MFEQLMLEQPFSVCGGHQPLSVLRANTRGARVVKKPSHLNEAEVIERVYTTRPTLLNWIADKIFPPPDKDGAWSTAVVERWLASRPVLIKKHIARPDDENVKAVIRLRKIGGEVYLIRDFSGKPYQRHAVEA